MVDLSASTITFLFTDIEGSTRLWEQHPHTMGAALARHDELLGMIITGYGGKVFKTVGDAVYAAFATAPEAVAAAVDGQLALQRETWGETGPLRVRMALHTGAAEMRNGDYFGPALNRVARLLAAGHGQQILLSGAVQELVRDHLPPEATLRDLGARRLKDLFRAERIFQLVIPELPADFPALKTLDSHPNNLPAQPNPLVGRERELEEVRALLRGPARLLTLTGPGGTGKTRLSLQVGADLLDAFTDGVFFVALAPISDPALVLSTIAQTLGVQESGGQSIEAVLQGHLRAKSMLLVLDNFEQVVAAGPSVAALLAGAPQLKLLVSSREPLQVYGEYEFSVPPLALPDPRHIPDLEALSHYEAVALFIARAKAVKPDFQVTNENAPALAELCARLDGLPLAIELAAAWVKLFRLPAMLARLMGGGSPTPGRPHGAALQWLTSSTRNLPPRQQTLRGAIAWSYDLLTPEEQALFARLAVFVGGCSLEAAEAVLGVDEAAPPQAQGAGTRLAGASLSVVDGLLSLVTKSLLRQTEGPDGEPRFVMLETIREYALEQLLARGELEHLCKRHATCYIRLAEQPWESVAGFGARMLAELDNCRAALRWLIDQGDVEMAHRLAGGLYPLWWNHGHLSEGCQWLEAVMALPGEIPPDLQAASLGRAGDLARLRGDYGRGWVWLEQSAELWRRLGDKRSLATVLNSLGSAAEWGYGDYKKARALQLESAALYQEVGDQMGYAIALNCVAGASLALGDDAGALARFQESEAIFREAGDFWGIAMALCGQAGVARDQGNYAAARPLLEEALDWVRQEEGDAWGTSFVLLGLSVVTLLQGDYAATEQSLTALLAIHRENGDRVTLANAYRLLGELDMVQGQFDSAAARYQESLRLYHEVGDTRGYATTRRNVGRLAYLQGHLGEAERCWSESISIFREVGDQGLTAACLEDLAALVLTKLGPAEGAPLAAQLLAAAVAYREVTQVRRAPWDRPSYEHTLAAVRATLDPEAFQAAWALGSGWSLDQALEAAATV